LTEPGPAVQNEQVTGVVQIPFVQELPTQHVLPQQTVCVHPQVRRCGRPQPGSHTLLLQLSSK